jgi:hypothetical protein
MFALTNLQASVALAKPHSLSGKAHYFSQLRSLDGIQSARKLGLSSL